MEDPYQVESPAASQDAEAPPATNPVEPPKDNAKGDDESSTSALLPRSVVGEIEPGQTITLKVVHVYEDEVEVEPVKSGKTSSQADEEIESLDEEE